jgi:hypothetical protein
VSFFIALSSLAIVAAIIDVNMWYRKERAAMTPEERKRDDEQADIDMQTW